MAATRQNRRPVEEHEGHHDAHEEVQQRGNFLHLLFVPGAATRREKRKERNLRAGPSGGSGGEDDWPDPSKARRRRAHPVAAKV
mmetsp:Transcript_10659/g.32077  ORF Transcript_10659/g.32077 Transcript_10659/m.32077 type:complete len:84 (-) Transcript_10659:1771-2022(-)